MKNYIVTVNGVSYEVSVEEVGEGQAAAPAAAPVKAAPVKAAAPAKKGSHQSYIHHPEPPIQQSLLLAAEPCICPRYPAPPALAQ